LFFKDSDGRFETPSLNTQIEELSMTSFSFPQKYEEPMTVNEFTPYFDDNDEE